MEIIGRRWTITYCLAGSLPGLLAMALAHAAGNFCDCSIRRGSFNHSLQCFRPLRLCEFTYPNSFPPRCAGAANISANHAGGSSLAWWRRSCWSRTPARRQSSSAPLAVVALIGAFVPVLFGKETVGQLETVSERVPGLA
jgi:hypothetical protein